MSVGAALSGVLLSQDFLVMHGTGSQGKLSVCQDPFGQELHELHTGALQCKLAMAQTSCCHKGRCCLIERSLHGALVVLRRMICSKRAELAAGTTAHQKAGLLACRTKQLIGFCEQVCAPRSRQVRSSGLLAAEHVGQHARAARWAHLLCRAAFLPKCKQTVTRFARVSAFLASFSYASSR